VLLLLLSHHDLDLVCAVTGALVNLSADANGRKVLLLLQQGSSNNSNANDGSGSSSSSSNNACKALVSALRRCGMRNTTLSCLICQAFHNLLSHGVAQEGSSAAASSSPLPLPPLGLEDTLDELLELAREMVEEEQQQQQSASQKTKTQPTSSEYAPFVKIGSSVLALIRSRSRTREEEASTTTTTRK